MLDPLSPAACRKALFMVRNRPSRSTSARPIGSMSSSACRLDDSRQRLRRSACRTTGKCRRRLQRSGSSGTCTARSGRRLAFGDRAASARLRRSRRGRRSARFWICRPDASARSANRLFAATISPFASTTAARTPAAASRSPVDPPIRPDATASGSRAGAAGKRHSSKSPSAPTRSTSTGWSRRWSRSRPRSRRHRARPWTERAARPLAGIVCRRRAQRRRRLPKRSR